MPPPEDSNITAGPEKCNIPEVQDKHFKIAINTMLTELSKDMTKFLHDVCENTTVE